MSARKTANSDLDESAFTVIDVETTGLSADKNRIIEIALVRVERLKITDKFQTYINPQTRIPHFITQFTGISDSDVADAPVFSEVADQIIDFMEGSVLTAHNMQFDLSFLNNELKITGNEPVKITTLCTLKLSRVIFPFLKSRSLGSVSKHLKIKNADSHRALSDAVTTARILIKLIRQLKKDNQITNLNDLLDYQTKLTLKPGFKINKELAADSASMPDKPGIYYFLNRKGEIIYIGKAKSLRERLKGYFSNSAQRKPKKIIKQAVKLKVEVTNTELTALLLEAELIKKMTPRHNQQLKSYGNKYFLRINKTHPVPFIEITDNFTFDGNDYFGLFTTKKKTKVVMEVLNKTFAVRECDEKEFLKARGCFMKDIERCTAPCLMSKSNIEHHEKEIDNVYEFLGGKNQTALNRLLNKMKHLSVQQKYEKAAEVKEIIDLILAQVQKNSLLQEPVNCAKVIFEITSGDSKDYLLLIEGRVFIKKYLLNKNDIFDEALNDYFDGNINYMKNPAEEDLEKLKISLNWLARHRNNVRVFYLKNFHSKQELFNSISNFNINNFESVKVYSINSLISAAF